jgi:hypothetical protein
MYDPSAATFHGSVSARAGEKTWDGESILLLRRLLFH